MIRLPLNKGDIIQLNNQQYTVEAVIGDGATCIVYSAYYLDSLGLKHQVNLKECYPYNVGIERNSQELVWRIEGEKEQYFASFRKTYEKLMTWQNESFAVNVFGFCEANNTLYIIMNADEGCTFDRECSGSLVDTLNTVKLLAHFVGKYHENGYLHLDVKPSNFLVYPRPSEHIVLFDMDSVTRIDDIKSGKVKGVSYSDDWAAPEQKQGKTAKLSPATDIFAVGAVLFEKVMGRRVNSFDMSVFADWDFNGDLFAGIHPKAKCLLREIFHKTLAASPKRRYQSAGELEAALEATRMAAEDPVYLISNPPAVTSHFVGRQQEIRAIRDFFASGSRAVVLHGFGGIGKSEIAKAYASKYESDYDAVVFVRYRGSLKEALENIAIHNVEPDTVEHSKELRRLLNQNALLIIDNLDIELGEEGSEYFDKVLQTKAHVLVTSRTDFSMVYSGEIRQIEVGELAAYELRQLFFHNSGIEIVSTEETATLNRILEKVQYHTLAVELLAKQIRSSDWTIGELYNKISHGFDDLGQAERINVLKDGEPLNKRFLDILRVVFKISKLRNEEKQTLQNLALLSFVELDRTKYKKVVREKNLDTLNDLIDLGWVETSRDYSIDASGKLKISLHALIEQMVLLDLKPTTETCPALFGYASKMIWDCRDWSLYGDLSVVEAAQWEYRRDFLCDFFCQIDLTIQSNLKIVLDWFNTVRENENDFGHFDLDYNAGHLSKLYDRLKLLLNSEDVSISDKFRVAEILFFAWVEQQKYTIHIGGDGEEFFRKQKEKMLGYFDIACFWANQLPAQEEKKMAVKELCEFVVAFREGHMIAMPEDWLRKVYELSGKKYPYDAVEAQRHNVETEALHETYFPDLTEDEEEEFDSEVYAKTFFPKFYSEPDACVAKILQEKQFDDRTKLEILHECFDGCFWRPICFGILPRLFDQINWPSMLKALSYEETSLCAYRAMHEDDDDVRYYADANYIYTTIALRGARKEEKFSEHMQRILDAAIDALQRDEKYYHQVRRHYFVVGTGISKFLDIVHVLTIMKCVEAAVPYMLEYIKAAEESFFDDDAKYIFYQEIVTCAQAASEESGIERDKADEYRRIAREYKEKSYELTGQALELKDNQ